MVIQYLRANSFSYFLSCKKKKIGPVHVSKNQDPTILCQPYNDVSIKSNNEYWVKMYKGT